MIRMQSFLAMMVMICGLYAAERPGVVVTTYPLYEVVNRVGGESVRLEKVLPYGTDIHTFRPTPATMVALSRADLFVYNGAGLEPWSEQLLTNLKATTRAVDMSRSVTLLGHEAQGHDDHDDHDAHEGHDHHHGPVDPHYWLDIDNMIAMTRRTEGLLAELLPEAAERFRANGDRFVKELEALRREYRSALHDCRRHHLVSNHDAFAYLAHDYGFETLAVTGLSPDQQPSAKAMAEVLRLVQEEGIRTIFFEAFVNDSVSRTLARETGAAVSSLQPLANLSADEAASNENYITIMRKNLAKIAEALECH